LKIYNDIASFTPPTRVIATQGTFDGVHLGHQKILKQVVKDAKAMQAESVLLTFHPHPRLVLNPNSQILQIQDIEDKIEVVAALGIDHMILMKFDNELSQLDPVDFVKKIWVDGIRLNKFIIGYDHKFGKDRKGNVDLMKKLSVDFNFEVMQIDAMDVENCIISSSEIRKSITNGNIEQAQNLLGRPFNLRGTVVSGRGIGKELGFPTANIHLNNNSLLIPLQGVYAVEIQLNEKRYYGMLNIGTKPTFNEHNQTVEVHIFDFNNKIYGQELNILFLKRIRNEKKFENKQKLIEQLRKDEAEIKHFFKLHTATTDI
jgi:riboflavin kinase/FMN adenylyltransferase